VVTLTKPANTSTLHLIPTDTLRSKDQGRGTAVLASCQISQTWHVKVKHSGHKRPVLRLIQDSIPLKITISATELHSLPAINFLHFLHIRDQIRLGTST